MQSGRAGKDDINAKYIFMVAQSKTVRAGKEELLNMTMKCHSFQF